MFSGCPSVRLSVCLSVHLSVCASVRPNCERDISWTDGRILTKLRECRLWSPHDLISFSRSTGQRSRSRSDDPKILWAQYLLNRWTDFDRTLHECHLWSPHDLIRFSRSTGQRSRSCIDDPKILVGAISPEPIDGFWPNFACTSSTFGGTVGPLPSA